MSPRSLATIMHSFGMLPHRHNVCSCAPLLAALACSRTVTTRVHVHLCLQLWHVRAPSQHAFMCTSACSFGMLAHRPPAPWIKSYLAATSRKMHSFLAGDLASCLWGVAILGIRPGSSWMQ
eukprot:1157103-Pelagomonas_calceolata.AAC.1